MKRGVQIFLQTAVILFTVLITAEAQPVRLTQLPNASGSLTKSGNLVYFFAWGAVYRTDGTAEGTIFLKDGFFGTGPAFLWP